MIRPMMKKICNLLFSLFTLLFSQELNGAPSSSFTLFVYMNGSNLETTHKLATSDIREILSAMKDSINNDNLTVVMLLGGTRQWHTRDCLGLSISSDSLTCVVITRQSVQKWRTFTAGSMGHSSTLSQFLRVGQSAFPAAYYGLIFWNHGSGSVGGFGYDECYPDDRSLSLREICEGLESSRLPDNKKFAFIGFDACLMATLEIATSLSPYADYLIASQELEPGGGWDYRSVIPLLASYTPSAVPDLYKKIVRSYINAYGGNEEVTLSVTRLNAVPALTASVEQFFSSQRAALVPSAFPRFSKARSQSKSFGMPAFTFSGPDMTDLLDLCNRMADLPIAAFFVTYALGYAKPWFVPALPVRSVTMPCAGFLSISPAITSVRPVRWKNTIIADSRPIISVSCGSTSASGRPAMPVSLLPPSPTRYCPMPFLPI